MPANNADDTYEITWLIRRLFRAMAQKSSETLVGLGISVADRAVMEFLYPAEELSVPAIAKRYKVSRQHVQVTVNALLDKGYLATKDNPGHKRSPLVTLTPKGADLFKKIRKQDDALISQAFSGISENARRTTHKTLALLLSRLS